jgi:cobalt/nickel transport system permease protein
MTLSSSVGHSSVSCLSVFDPSAKIVGTVLFTVAVALLHDVRLLLFALLFMICLLAISGVPWARIGKRYGLAFPFIILAALSMYLTSGQSPAIGMFLRISASVLALILLSVTAGFLDLLNGLQMLKVPRLVVSMFMFTHRYIYVFTEELERMSLARQARGYRGGGSLMNRDIMATVTNTAGMLLVRAYERGLRVHDSLVARGYEGEVRTLSRQGLHARDAAFCGSLAFMGVFLLSIEFGVVA